MATVLFDIDGTLINTGGAGKIAFAETFRELFGVDRISADVGFAGRSDRAIAQDLMTAHGIEVSAESWLRFKLAFVPQLHQVLPRLAGKVLPGVAELLDELARFDHVAVGLLTGNIAAGARAKLSYYRLHERFAFGGYGDDWTDRCDIARAALEAAKRHRNGTWHATEKVIVIGDTIADIQCARAIEAFAVAVATGGASIQQLTDARPDVLVADLSDSSQVLALLDEGK